MDATRDTTIGSSHAESKEELFVGATGRGTPRPVPGRSQSQVSEYRDLWHNDVRLCYRHQPFGLAIMIHWNPNNRGAMPSATCCRLVKRFCIAPGWPLVFLKTSSSGTPVQETRST